MLRTDPYKTGPLKTHGFLVSVEAEDGYVNPEALAERLGSACTFMEGVGHIDVNYMGQIDEEETE